MSFTELTDLIGITQVASSSTPGSGIETVGPAVIPAIEATSLRDYFSNAFDVPLVFLQPKQTYSLIGDVGIGGPISGNVTSQGIIRLSYIFEDSPVPVPEPVPSRS